MLQVYSISLFYSDKSVAARHATMTSTTKAGAARQANMGSPSGHASSLSTSGTCVGTEIPGAVLPANVTCISASASLPRATKTALSKSSIVLALLLSSAFFTSCTVAVCLTSTLTRTGISDVWLTLTSYVVPTVKWFRRALMLTGILLAMLAETCLEGAPGSSATEFASSAPSPREGTRRHADTTTTVSRRRAGVMLKPVRRHARVSSDEPRNESRNLNFPVDLARTRTQESNPDTPPCPRVVEFVVVAFVRSPGTFLSPGAFSPRPIAAALDFPQRLPASSHSTTPP